MFFCLMSGSSINFADTLVKEKRKPPQLHLQFKREKMCVCIYFLYVHEFVHMYISKFKHHIKSV